MRPTITYTDTRGVGGDSIVFSEAIVTGIAPGGGLFVPVSLPQLDLETILSFSAMPYWRRAATVYSLFGIDFDNDRIDALMRQAYGAQWDDERIAPVVEVRADMHVIELWHGPTSAFKDMALQCMPHFFSASIEKRRAIGALDDDMLILVATSGDTGKAALDGFADRSHTRIAVFYPADGVSDIQRLQMVTQLGENVAVFGVTGNFDDCQSAVKAVFADDEFNRLLHERHGLRLSSANSINWGRLLPQIVYYVSAYSDMVAGGGVEAGHPLDVCVPTGNFGNILGAYYAKRMGVPLGRLICASNENNVLADFIATGTYDISSRSFVTTPSPSMDILISSNLERLLSELSDAESVKGWMHDLATTGRFKVDPETYRAVRAVLDGDFVTNDESLATIRRVWEESGYLLDPHTAVAWEVAERLRGTDPVLIVSTAHWGKFGTDVLRALDGIPRDQQPLADDGTSSGLSILHTISSRTGGSIPANLSGLEDAPIRFDRVVDAGKDGVERALIDWLG